MDINNIKKFIQLMKANQLTELELEEEGFRISLKRREGSEPHIVMSSAAAPSIMMAHPGAVAAAPTPAATAAAEAAKEKAEAESKYVDIKSPIVGTFYRSPAPDAEPFVTVGQQIDKETVVCIVEAMKVMNEIKAEVRGVVKKILVENATAIQFGQPLFQIEPN
jgi:acetyl-CoA carboxylase biotin carboxyl carrier protein